MKMPIIEAYLDDLIKNSTLDVPAWNIEAARKGGKSGWNYIDVCMILAMIETWKITGEKKYLDFAVLFLTSNVIQQKQGLSCINIINIIILRIISLYHTGKNKSKKRKIDNE